MFETGKIEHILAAIDNIVNGEVNLPPGDQKKLFERIREVGQGYTVIGTNYTYNSRDQLVHRENMIRYEDYDYAYDAAGNLLTDGRSKYEWNARGQLTKVTFPDGFGEKYTYDMLGRRVTKTDFNHQGETQQTTTYHYKGDTWNLTGEVVSGDGDDSESSKSYTYDANGRPLSITFKGQTFWYVYNGHGDVVALTDKDGQVAARYEYDAWGLVTAMYNRYGERVREGIGWMGDLGSGNGSPGSLQGPEDDSGNTVPDYEPGNGQNNGTGSSSDGGSVEGNGNGKGNGNGNGKKTAVADVHISSAGGNGKGKGNASQSQNADQSSTVEAEPSAATETDSVTDNAAAISELNSILAETEEEPTEDITTDLVKENPFRYAGYYWDRKTQYYYLQARYYDPRQGRFVSEDTYEGEIENPQSLNQYVYVQNNPATNIDPTGQYCISADGKNAHKGLCSNTSTGWWFEDHNGQLIINNGDIVGLTGMSREHAYEKSYEPFTLDPKTYGDGVRRPGPNAIPRLVVKPINDLASYDVKIEFNGEDDLSIYGEFKTYAGGVQVTDTKTGVITKVEFSAGAAQVGVNCDKTKCFIGADVTFAEITIAVASPIFDTGYYVVVEGGLVAGYAAKVFYEDGIIRAKFAFEGGVSFGVGITKNP